MNCRLLASKRIFFRTSKKSVTVIVIAIAFSQSSIRYFCPDMQSINLIQCPPIKYRIVRISSTCYSLCRSVSIIHSNLASSSWAAPFYAAGRSAYCWAAAASIFYCSSSTTFILFMSSAIAAFSTILYSSSLICYSTAFSYSSASISSPYPSISSSSLSSWDCSTTARTRLQYSW